VQYVAVDGAWFRVHLSDGDDCTDINDVKSPTFTTGMIGGVEVVLIDGIGRLDSADRTLNKIIRAKIHELNGWIDYPGWTLDIEIHFFDLKDTWDSPFYDSPIKRWKYGRREFNNVEINYIAGGHVFHHLGVPSDYAYAFVFYWKSQFKDPDGNPVQPTAGTWYWFNKGYNEYDERKGW
jgi:hypothetical protein